MTNVIAGPASGWMALMPGVRGCPTLPLLSWPAPAPASLARSCPWQKWELARAGPVGLPTLASYLNPRP